jgi:hypothetical protein
MENVNVDADMMLDDDIGDLVAVTLGGISWQFSILAKSADWGSLAQVPRISASQRADFRLGTAMGLQVWWCLIDGVLLLTIGGAPEDSSMSFALQPSVLERIPEAILEVIDEGWDNAR